jgi:hypothetical protein
MTVRTFLTVVVVVVSFMLLLPLVLLKAVEGIYYCYVIAKDSIAQVWAPRKA